MKKLNRKFLVVPLLFAISFPSFSAITGAKYFSVFISALEDLASDSKKVIVAVAILFLIIAAARALSGNDSQNFVVSLFHGMFIVAAVGIVATIIVAVGGATINEDVLKDIQTKNITVAEKNIGVVYERE